MSTGLGGQSHLLDDHHGQIDRERQQPDDGLLPADDARLPDVPDIDSEQRYRKGQQTCKHSHQMLGLLQI